MLDFSRRRCAAALVALSMGGCSQYSAMSERRPDYRYQPYTPVGRLIVHALEDKKNKPEAILGCYLDAASQAANVLEVRPKDTAALRDYNYAVGRMFEVIRDANLHPWHEALHVPGAAGDWALIMPHEKDPQRDPANYESLPADRYLFRGTYVDERKVKPGLGAPLVVTSKFGDCTKLDRFAQGRRVYYGVTALVNFQGRRATFSFLDPLSTECTQFKGHAFYVAADYTAPLAMALAREDPRKIEILRLLRPQAYAETARLARLQPYDPNKIPVIFIHGLMDSQATWIPLINQLRADPEIRARYQFWFYSYPSGYPYPHSAAIMRRQLDEMNAAYPGHKKVVLIGHSMGGVICRSMITDSHMALWNTFFSRPPEQTLFTQTTRQTLSDALIFKSRSEVGRVIFIATPHRGSELASDWMGRFGSWLVKGPSTFLKIAEETRQLLTLDMAAIQMDRMPNSIDTLSPKNRFVVAINKLPLTPGIPFHSIMGDRGKGGNDDHSDPVSSDGIVPFWSSHLEGARSELRVASGHSAHQNPQAIEEVRRILKLHASN